LYRVHIHSKKTTTGRWGISLYSKEGPYCATLFLCHKEINIKSKKNKAIP
jgi:hypothetical protein